VSAKSDFLEYLRSRLPQPENYDAFGVRPALPQRRPQSRPSKRKPAQDDHLTESVEKRLQNEKAFPLMSVEEVAFVFMKSRATIYRWLEEGKLARPKAGGRILTRSVLAFLRKRQPTIK
jgi:excisionase family DNA binding protein